MALAMEDGAGQVGLRQLQRVAAAEVAVQAQQIAGQMGAILIQ